MTVTLTNRFKLIFILIPLNYIISFFTFVFFNIQVDLHAYIVVLQMVLIAYWFKNQRKLNIILLVYLIVYTLVYNVGYPLTHKARYMLMFVSTISIMWLIIKDGNKLVKLSDKDSFFEKFSILFIVIYLISIPFSIPSFESNDRLYLNGFIIPHHFAYYMAILGYFFLNRGKTTLGTIILLFGVLTGTRTGLILAILPLFFLFNKNFNLSKLLLLFFSIVIVFLVSFILFNDFTKTQLDYYTSFFNSALQPVSASDQQSFTSYRSVVWLNFIVDYLDKPFQMMNFFGHGPKSSLSFNEDTLGVPIWMHNDFLDIYFCYGYFGLSIYIYTIYMLIKSTKSLYLFFFILICAFLNGFITYSTTQILLVATVFILENANRKIFPSVLTPKPQPI